MGGAKTCQAEAYPQITEMIHLSLCKLWMRRRMKFFRKPREQKAKYGCLRESLSGKGQTLLTAQVPAPGGDR